jgi:hypothetical protein
MRAFFALAAAVRDEMTVVRLDDRVGHVQEQGIVGRRQIATRGCSPPESS